jgi:glycerophosphoryl diester phosphodiesterase
MLFGQLLKQTGIIGAHRGYRACYPENTLCAFAASIGRCHFIELDVQMSRDGVPVIIHDDRLDRTSDALTACKSLGYTSCRVDQWSLADLRRLDMGSWFAAAAKNATEASLNDDETWPPWPRQQIMTLVELLHWAKPKDIGINIELKDHRNSPHHLRLVEAVVAAIDSTASAESVLISSFNHHYLQQCKALNPALLTGALQEDHHPPDLVAYLQRLGVDAYHPCQSITDAAVIASLRGAGFAVNVFTVNDPKRQQQLFADGVTAIITDYPALTDRTGVN